MTAMGSHCNARRPRLPTTRAAGFSGRSGRVSWAVASLDRTRELIARHLGVALAVRAGEGYREADGSLLAGEWLGAFAQPAVILNTVSAMSLRLDEQGGASIDEYGEA